ncbi:hypothetical protein LEMLEM_LOCUS20318 [Lemmus lemmus]
MLFHLPQILFHLHSFHLHSPEISAERHSLSEVTEHPHPILLAVTWLLSRNDECC